MAAGSHYITNTQIFKISLFFKERHYIRTVISTYKRAALSRKICIKRRMSRIFGEKRLNP